MPSEKVVFGVPGCGKTTFGTSLARGWVKAGADPSEVAYLGFTKAAAKAAATKILGVEDEEATTTQFPFFRTIHSLSLMGLKRKRPDVKMIKTSDMKQFARVSGMEGTYAVHEWEELADVFRGLKDGGKNEWDKALAAYHVTRLQAQSRSDLERARVEPCNEAFLMMGMQNSTDKVYETFVKHYERFKVAEGLIDFTDMDPIPVKYGIIDESQDLCPLHYSVLDRVLSKADEIFWIGDDDQAVFEWSGAKSELFLDRAQKAAYKIELRQTHRYGQDIAALAARVIGRVSRRYPKTVLPVEGKDCKIAFSGEFKPIAGDVMVLHRFKSGCAQIARAYMDAGIPFRNERGQDPMGAHAQVMAWGALNRLAAGEQVSMVSAARLIEELMPSTVVDEHSKKVRLVVHGAKAKLENLPNQSVNLWDLVRAELLTSEGAHVIQERDYRTLKHADNLEFYDRANRNGYDLEATGPNVKVARVTTIHGAKGREAREVVVFNEMTGKCWQNPDAEHRLAYVAATRTQSDLTICLESKIDWAKEIYDYPVEG